jgi:hypothetical protein
MGEIACFLFDTIRGQNHSTAKDVPNAKGRFKNIVRDVFPPLFPRRTAIKQETGSLADRLGLVADSRPTSVRIAESATI